MCLLLFVLNPPTRVPKRVPEEEIAAKEHVTGQVAFGITFWPGKVLDYLQSNRNLKCRRQLLESLGFWRLGRILHGRILSTFFAGLAGFTVVMLEKQNFVLVIGTTTRHH